MAGALERDHARADGPVGVASLAEERAVLGLDSAEEHLAAAATGVRVLQVGIRRDAEAPLRVVGGILFCDPLPGPRDDADAAPGRVADLKDLAHHPPRLGISVR